MDIRVYWREREVALRTINRAKMTGSRLAKRRTHGAADLMQTGGGGSDRHCTSSDSDGRQLP